VAWAMTLLFVMGCWVLFRAADFTTARDILLAMLGRNGIGHISLDREYVGALVGGAIVVWFFPTSQEAALTKLQPNRWFAMPAGVALAYLLLLIGGRLPNVFIYFQF
jgi:alginate O-acetyltransferase complex protein AlgI